MLKHGVENFKFDIIYQSMDFEHCLSMETYFIKEYNTFGGKSGYNHTMGGEDRKRSDATIEKHRNKMKGKKQSDEHKAKRGLTIRGEKNGMYGRSPDPTKNAVYLQMAQDGLKEYRKLFKYFYYDIWGNVYETDSKDYLMELMGAKTWDTVKNTTRPIIRKGKTYEYKFKNGFKFLGCWKSLLE
jgi:hypothetical protein